MARPDVLLTASRIKASAERLFRWHAEPGALERLTPPPERIEIIARSRGIRDGGLGGSRPHAPEIRTARL
jgi:hypothetical protein